MSLFSFLKLNRDTDLDRWLHRGTLVAVLLACAVALSLNIADPDLWGHIQYGRDALAHGLPATTTYSYIAQGYPWINHELIAEYALALIDDFAGGPGLLITKCLLGLAVVGTILFRARRHGAGLIAACSFTLLIAITLGNHWSLRPQLISYICFPLLLALLSYCFAGWDGKWQLGSLPFKRTKNDNTADQAPLDYDLPRLKLLWLAPPLFMLWTNSHGGFLAGLCIFLAYLGLRGIEAIRHKGRAADGLLIRFALMAAASIAATFLNPYGLNFHRWLYHDLKVPRPEIVEWRAPELLDPQFLPFWLLLVASVAAITFSKRSRDFTHVTILGLILWQALTHHRHIAFFAIAAGWWLPLHWDSLLTRLGVTESSESETSDTSHPATENAPFLPGLSPQFQRGFGVVLLLAIAICSVQLIRRVTTLKVERSAYPVAAFDFIARQQLNGNMLCTFNWAQYALAAFGPHEPNVPGILNPGILVQVDGRCRTSYSQAMLDAHFDFLIGAVDPSQRYRDPNSGPFDPNRVLSEGQPDLVLISRLQLPSVEVMQRQTDWVLLYQDSLAQLWGRADKYNDPNISTYIAPDHRQITDAPQLGYTPWPAFPSINANREG